MWKSQPNGGAARLNEVASSNQSLFFVCPSSTLKTRRHSSRNFVAFRPSTSASTVLEKLLDNLDHRRQHFPRRTVIHDDELPPQHPRQGPRVGARLEYLDLPPKRADHTRRVRCSGRLPRLQVPDLVLGRCFTGQQAPLVSASGQAVLGDERRAMPSQTR